MSRGIVDTIAGGALIAAGVLIEVGTLGGGTPLAIALITAGAGLVLTGIGTMLKGNVQGFATTTRNPIAPWEIPYGRTRIGGTIVYLALHHVHAAQLLRLCRPDASAVAYVLVHFKPRFIRRTDSGISSGRTKQRNAPWKLGKHSGSD